MRTVVRGCNQFWVPELSQSNAIGLSDFLENSTIRLVSIIYINIPQTLLFFFLQFKYYLINLNCFKLNLLLNCNSSWQGWNGNRQGRHGSRSRKLDNHKSPSWLEELKANSQWCTSSKAWPGEGIIAFTNSWTNWGKSVKIHEPPRNISLSRQDKLISLLFTILSWIL